MRDVCSLRVNDAHLHPGCLAVVLASATIALAAATFTVAAATVVILAIVASSTDTACHRRARSQGDPDGGRQRR